jgi:hypothetical protein
MSSIPANVTQVKARLALMKSVRERGLETPHRAFLVLKSLEGSTRRAGGIVGWCEAVNTLVEFMSLPRVYQVLSEGEGVFWRTIRQRHRKALLLVGVTTLLDRWNPELVSSRVIHLPVAALKGHDWKAALHACEMRGIAKDGTPVSRQCIKRLTGLSEATQRRYCRSSRIRRVFNFSKTSRTCKIHVDHDTHQLPNSYQVEGLEASRSGRIKAWARRNTDSHLGAAPSTTEIPQYFSGKGAGNRAIKLRERGVRLVNLRVSPPSRSVAWWESTSFLIYDCLKGDPKRGSHSEGVEEEEVSGPEQNLVTRVTPAEVVKSLRGIEGLSLSMVSDGTWGNCVWCARGVSKGVAATTLGRVWYAHSNCLRPKVIDLFKSLAEVPS